MNAMVATQLEILRKGLSCQRIQGLGWVRDLPDQRDLTYPSPELSSTPDQVDLRDGFPPVYDQGDLGSCTANAIGGVIQFVQRREGIPEVMPSRLFIYYNERVIGGNVGHDSGAQIRDGIKSVVRLGACREADWPYHPRRFAVEPPARAYTDALKGIVTKYMRVPQAAEAMFEALTNRHPFVAGLSAFESFMDPVENGTIPMPSQGEKRLGGHAVVIVGYDRATSRFTFRNSWGESWGQNGYGTLTFDYLLSPGLAADFWAILKER